MKLLHPVIILVLFVFHGGAAPRPAKRVDKPRPPNAADFEPVYRTTDGNHLGLSIRKLKKGFDPPRPFLIWALGSSYTAKLGNGDELIALLQECFGRDREIVYRRMVGNSCPWQYLRGWARHLVVPDQPDLVLIYTNGKTPDLEKLIREIRSQTTADIIVPSIHWRERGKALLGKSENAPDQNVTEARELCRRYKVEFVENRKDWEAYLNANKLTVEDLLNDAVHQSGYGATIVNRNIAAHFRFSGKANSGAQFSETRIGRNSGTKVEFTGNRIDLVATRGPGGGKAQVLIDGKPADQVSAFRMTYLQPAKSNFQERRSPARDQSPHGVGLGTNIVPQKWTIRLLDDKGNFELSGSVTGKDGRENAFEPFVSASGQIIIRPDEWRRAERNRKGDGWTWEVIRTTVGEVDFAGEKTERFRVTLAMLLPNDKHQVELKFTGKIPPLEFDLFRPPLD